MTDQTLERRVDADRVARGKPTRLVYRQGFRIDHHILNWIGQKVMVTQSTGQCEYYVIVSAELQADMSLLVRFKPRFTSMDYDGPESPFELTDHEPLVQISITRAN